jgi:hypothetical protein
VEKYLGLVALGVVLFYVFRDPRGTGDLVSSIADANVSGIAALQGQGAGRSFYPTANGRLP